MGRQEERSHYFQAIARAFLDLRGEPFVLSSRDQLTIAAWEEERIPLSVVLEGMKRAGEKFRLRNPGQKMPALSFCQGEVKKAFETYQERRVGKATRVISRAEKRKRARAEVDRFRRSLPREWAHLRPILDQAVRLLSRSIVAEEDLERLEEKLDALLLEKVSEKEKAEVEKRLRAELPGQRRAVDAAAAAAWLVKSLRQKLKIPHFPLYYY